MNINIDSKSQLAKLLATENITIQHNNVQTASFNLEDRVLTIPVFKNPKGAVYDMLIAHEVSHALHTPADEWKKCLDEGLLEIKDYINVIEDVRIDKLIQKKYPGVVQDYKDGFNILWNDDFFNVRNKNLNTELMLIDKINLYFKSSKQLDEINFSNEDKLFVDLVDSCKTFADVVEAAKKLSDWQKKQNENLKKLPDFDSHPLTKMYGEQEKSEEDDNDNSQSNSTSQSSDQNNEQEKSESDSQNEPVKSEDASNENGDGSKESEDGKEKDKSESIKNQTGNPDGAGGKDVKINMPMKSITQNNIDNSIQKRYVDSESRGYNYFQIPDANLDNIIYSNKNWLQVNNDYMNQHHSKVHIQSNFEEYKKFKRDSKATISYLVKEFEMKKSAEGYKRQTTDKTGIIDPLKLHKYKISEDIFKRLSVIPDAKNHGMILLLDWSGSMSNCIGKTVDQLLQLVWFCKQINIPFKVYFFSDRISDATWNERRFDAKENKKSCYNFKAGDSRFEAYNLVEIANHTLKKQKLDQSLFYLYAYGKYYNDHYSYRRRFDGEYIERLYPPSEFHLSSTPLNEALATMYKVIPLFKTKYQVSKLSLITLTDGHSNNNNKGNFATVDGRLVELPERGYGSQGILKLSKGKEIKSQGGTTGLLLQGLKKKFGITTIGFFILKSARRWEFDRYALSQRQQKLTWDLQDQIKMKVRQEYNKHKAASVEAYGYNEFYLINGKDMVVQNANLDELKEDAKKGDIRRVFSKSMKQRTVSRVLLNKFIRQVA